MFAYVSIMKLKLKLLSLATIISNFIIGQTVFLNGPYDLGNVNASNYFIDIPVKNTSDSKVYIFRTESNRDVKTLISNKSILPDSTVIIRAAINPSKEGYFNETIYVHFSCYDEPKKIKISGYSNTVATNNIECPNFSSREISNPLVFYATIQVIDAETREPIKDANITLVKNGQLQEELKTNKSGFVKKKIPLGLYFFISDAEGYFSNEFVQYTNRNNNVIIIPLEKQKEEESVTVTIEENQIDTNVVVAIDTAETIIPEIFDEKYPEFPLSIYKPNNIVFLVDISTSMKFSGKLELLKVAMIELTQMLRDEDKITIIAYADNANVILETTSGSEKDTIIQLIQSLEAKGLTAGGKGMKKAYTKALDEFLEDGNNQVIMATDGAFNKGDENPNKLALKYNRKGVNISILGIKIKPTDEGMLLKVSTSGDGRFVKVDNYNDAKNNLKEEIRISSRK